MIYKNWLVDARVNCKLVVGNKLGEFFVAEMLLEENEEVLEKASHLRRNNHVFVDVRWVAYAF
jgi:hypothetical protein